MCGSHIRRFIWLSRVTIDAVELQIAHCLRALSLSKKAVEQLVFHLRVAYLRIVRRVFMGLHFSCFFCIPQR